jgi:hypothetical protein
MIYGQAGNGFVRGARTDMVQQTSDQVSANNVTKANYSNLVENFLLKFGCSYSSCQRIN